jgi:hypothetical protein
MPKAFDKWQVFPHRPIEKLEPNLWRVEGDLPGGSATRVMAIAKLRDGGLVIHNGIALEPELMAEIEAFGKPAYLVVPNGFHRLDSKIFKERYPSLKVICPAAAKKKVAEVVPVDLTYAEMPKDEDVSFVYWDGTAEREGFMVVKSPGGKTTLVINDVISNLRELGGMWGFLMAPTGRASVPRLIRWMMVKDKKALGAQLERLAAEPQLGRVIVSHGSLIDEAPAALRGAASLL